MITDLDPVNHALWIANNMERKRYEYDLMPEDLVLDIGAYQGEFAEKIHDKYGCEVVCVEPTGSANYMARHPWCNVINAAASTDNVPLKFGGAFYYTSLMLEGTQVYPCFDVLELLDREISLMKLNVEGMEWVLLRRIIDSGLQRLVKYFQIQFHRINEASEFTYIHLANDLLKTHDLMWRVPYIWESWTRK